MLTRDGKKLKGVLTAVTDEDFTLEVTRKVKEPGAKRPVMVAEPTVIPMARGKAGLLRHQLLGERPQTGFNRQKNKK